jgi:hypothetical protein
MFYIIYKCQILSRQLLWLKLRKGNIRYICYLCLFLIIKNIKILTIKSGRLSVIRLFNGYPVPVPGKISIRCIASYY